MMRWKRIDFKEAIDLHLEGENPEMPCKPKSKKIKTLAYQG